MIRAGLVQIRYEEGNVTSVAFNQDHEDTLAYSGQQMLSVRTGSHRPSRQHLNSLVVAFHGTTVYCLHNQELQQQEVALGGTVEQLMDAGKWTDAFKVACLGVPLEVWDALGSSALLALNLDIAQRAYIQTHDFLMLNLVHRLKLMRQAAVHDSILVGEVLAQQARPPWDGVARATGPRLPDMVRKLQRSLNQYMAVGNYTECNIAFFITQGKYEDAAHAFAKAKAGDRIMEMWTDLRQFDKAKKWAQLVGQGDESVDAIQAQQAQWSEEIRDYKAAAEVYICSGEHEKAVSLLVRNTLDWSYLLQVTRKLDR